MVYLPFLQSEFRGTADTPASIEVRLLPESRLTAEEIQRAIRSSAAGLAARRVRFQNSLVERTLIRDRLLSVISVSLGVMAMALAGFGLGGAVAQSVASRLKEFGLRMALGATNKDLVRSGLGRALAPVAAGIAIGAPLSFGVARLLRGVLFGVEPFDPLVMSGAILLFLAVTSGAACVPLIGVTRIDPASALRQE